MTVAVAVGTTLGVPGALPPVDVPVVFVVGAVVGVWLGEVAVVTGGSDGFPVVPSGISHTTSANPATSTAALERLRDAGAEIVDGPAV